MKHGMLCALWHCLLIHFHYILPLSSFFIICVFINKKWKKNIENNKKKNSRHYRYVRTDIFLLYSKNTREYKSYIISFEKVHTKAPLSCMFHTKMTEYKAIQGLGIIFNSEKLIFFDQETNLWTTFFISESKFV